MDNSPGGVILYAGSSGSSSPSPGSPSGSSGYQTQSPSSNYQPSSPEEASYPEAAPLKQRTAPSPKLVFQFPDVSHTSALPPKREPWAPPPYAHPMMGKRPFGFTGTFTKSGGMVLLCKVCGDIASGFHYGVHACEGCKGFFRRSIQQNIHYKMCVKNENCLIMRMNRNRCQHCRFKKCLSVGMSRDAVRFGRIPKREKQRLLDEMQSYMNSLNESSSMEMDSSPPSEAPPSPEESQSDEAVGAISQAYRSIFVRVEERGSRTGGNKNKTSNDNCPKARSNPPHGSSPGYLSHSTTGSRPSQRCPVAPHDRPSAANINNSHFNSPRSSSQSNRNHPANHSSLPTGESPSPTSCPWRFGGGVKVLACPLNSCPVSSSDCSSQQVWEAFSQSFTPAVREVVEFAKSIPGFQTLSQHDQVTLLKAGTFQVLMVRFCSLFDPKERTVTFLNGETYPLPSLRALGMGSLLDAMFDFSEKLAALELEPDEMALFMAVVLVSAERSGIVDVGSVEELQEGLISALRSLLTRRRPDNSAVFPKLLLCLPDLRTLNSTHSDKLLAFRIDA